MELFIHGETITLEKIKACMYGGIRASPEQLSNALHGKLSRTDRQLSEDSLEEYRFYSQKTKRIEEDIMTHFSPEVFSNHQ